MGGPEKVDCKTEVGKRILDIQKTDEKHKQTVMQFHFWGTSRVQLPAESKTL